MTACGDDAKGAEDIRKEQQQKFDEEMGSMSLKALKHRRQEIDELIDTKVSRSPQR